MLGVLEQQLLSGAISWEEYGARAKAAEQLMADAGGDKGMKEFASGLSSSLSSAVGKMTDFQAIITEASRKGGQSIFQQFSKDAADFTAELEKLLLKLLIINPLLNSLGLGDQGNGKQLPTLWGSAGGSGGIGGLLSWLFGGPARARRQRQVPQRMSG